MPTIVATVGHSSRPLAEFIELLHAYDVRYVVDVRKLPRSAAQPQYNYETLPAALVAEGIGYTYLPGLAGLRKRRAGSTTTNTGWQNRSFQAYADHMQTEEFASALQTLMDLARRERVAVMCAEAVPWRCHRRLIADALLVRGFAVADLLSPTESRPHLLTPWAKVDGTRITYPPE